MKKYSFIYGTILLVIVNFIVRSLGFIYKIIFSRLIGPEAIGLYQIVFPFLMVFITITSAGIPLAVSRIVAKENSLNNRIGIYKVLSVSLFIGGILSLVLSIFLSINMDFIVTKILKNRAVYYPLLFSIPSIGLITFSGIFRGFFYGLKDMKPPANAQIFEQVSRIAFVLLYLLYKKPSNPIIGATIGVIGISIGEFFGLLYLILRFNMKKLSAKIHFIRTYTESSFKIASSILFIALPISIGRLASTLLQTATSILIPQRLVMAGYTTSEAIQIFGKITGMAMPLLFFPFTVTSALSVNIIPNISEQIAMNRLDDVNKQCNLAIKITLLVAIPVTITYAAFGNFLGHLIYKDLDVGKYLTVISYSTIFLCMQQTLSSILHGMGKQVISTLNFLLGMVIQLYCTYFLVSNPIYGINGFFIGYVTSAFVIFILNLIVLKRSIKIKFPIIELFVKPTFCSILVVCSMLYIYKGSFIIVGNELLSTFIAALTGGILYLTLLTITKTLNTKSMMIRSFEKFFKTNSFSKEKYR